MSLRSMAATLLTVATIGASQTAIALEAGDWVARIGGAYLTATSESDDVSGSPGARVEADDGSSLGFSIGYMLTDHWSVDLLGAIPFSHDIEGRGTLDGAGTVATTDQLPPTLSLLYYFQPDSHFRPYAGLGLNYTIFYNENGRGPLASANIELDDSIGLALNLGADLDINERWFANLSAWYVDLTTEASINGGAKFDVAIDPVVVMFGLGRVF